MYYYKARIYSPTLGRFLQTDPVGYQDQMNLYEYVGDDPVNHTDPTGMATDDEIRQARQTLNSLKAAIRRDIADANVPAVGSRMVSSSDRARVQGLKTQLTALGRLDPAELADRRVNAPDSTMANGLTNSITSGGTYEIPYAATDSGGTLSYGPLQPTSHTEDSGQARSPANLRLLGHAHAPGNLRQYPWVGDPAQVLISRVPNIFVLGDSSNAIGWNGTRFTLTNVRGTMPSYESAPQWIRDTFTPW